MSRTPAQRGPFGNWLKERREARYPTQAKALEEMRRLAGLAIAPSEYAQWEAGSRTPRPDNPKVRALVDFFGGDPFAAYAEKPADATPAGFSDLLPLQQQLVTAFETQAQAVMALVMEMRLSREVEVEDLRARALALEAQFQRLEATMRSLHPELDTPVSEGQAAPRATTE